MENIREELKTALKSHYSEESSIENVMKVVKKHMIDKLTLASDVADKRSEGYSRFSRHMMSIIDGVKNA